MADWRQKKLSMQKRGGDLRKFLIFICVIFTFIGTAPAATMQYTGVITELSGSSGSSSLYGLVEVGDIVEGYFILSNR